MAELAPQERLQPSLLDRLTDHEPHKQVESRDNRVLTVDRLREAVLRDLGWLLNTDPSLSRGELDDMPHVRNSVLNYGFKDLSGQTLSGLDTVELEAGLLEAIIAFEPRIQGKSIAITLKADPAKMSHNALIFSIQGELWAYPIPLQLFLKTQIDLEDGSLVVSESDGVD
jgi:type VI secretion system protein ImpF